MLERFPETTYYQAHFSKLTLAVEVMTARTFEECEFTACSFVSTKFEKCRFLNCKFADSVLSAIVPMDCRVIDLKFRNCKVIGIDWTKTQKLQQLDFDKCQINYSNFRFLKLPGVKITNCEAKEADFTEADVHDGDFNNTDFERTRFFKTDLSNCNFRGATNYSINTANNILKKAQFSLPEAVSLLNGLDIVIE